MRPIRTEKLKMKRFSKYSRTHKGKKGFQFDVTERLPTYGNGNNKKMFRIFTATKNKEHLGDIYYDKVAMKFYKYYNTKVLKKGDAGISEFKIQPKYRSKGIGSALLDKVIRTAKRDNKKRIVLATAASNVKAQKLYHKYGFKKIPNGEEIWKVNKGKQKIIMMAKELK